MCDLFVRLPCLHGNLSVLLGYPVEHGGVPTCSNQCQAQMCWFSNLECTIYLWVVVSIIITSTWGNDPFWLFFQMGWNLKPPTRSLFIIYTPKMSGWQIGTWSHYPGLLLEIVSHPSAGTQPWGMWLWWVFRKGWHVFIGKRVSMQSFKTDFWI